MSDAALELGKLYEAILTGNARGAVELTQASIPAQVDPQELITTWMIPAMDEVGRRGRPRRRRCAHAESHLPLHRQL
jgi:methanogenic corrinoid protein MtbC1